MLVSLGSKGWAVHEDMAVQNSSFEQGQGRVDAVINEEHILARQNGVEALLLAKMPQRTQF